MKLALFLLASMATAQINVSKSPYCPTVSSTSYQVLLFVPVQIGTSFMSFPVCALVGPNLVVTNNSSTGAWILSAASVSGGAGPKRVFEKFTIFPANLPPEQKVYPVTLSKQPAPGTIIIAFFKASQAFGDAMDIAPAPLTKEVSVMLPNYRPFLGDVITIVYETLE